MRLYNAQSCTPVATSNYTPPRTQWLPTRKCDPTTKIPWGQDVLKKTRYHKGADLHQRSDREKSQAFSSDTSDATSFHNCFNPFKFPDDSNKWQSNEVIKDGGSPESNKGSTRTSSTHASTSSDDRTPDGQNCFDSEENRLVETDAKDKFGVTQLFEAEEPKESLYFEQKLLLSPVSTPSEDSSLTSSSTFFSSSSDGCLNGALHPDESSTYSPPLETVSSSDLGWPPKNAFPTQSNAVLGFPTFDIDSMTVSSKKSENWPSEKCEAEELFAGRTNHDAEAALQPPRTVPSQLETCFRGIGPTSRQNGSKSAPSFIPKTEVVGNDDFLAVRAKLKRVTTTRGGPFRAHTGVSPPPKVEKRSVVVTSGSQALFHTKRHRPLLEEGSSTLNGQLKGQTRSDVIVFHDRNAGYEVTLKQHRGISSSTLPPNRPKARGPDSNEDVTTTRTPAPSRTNSGSMLAPALDPQDSFSSAAESDELFSFDSHRKNLNRMLAERLKLTAKNLPEAVDSSRTNKKLPGTEANDVSRKDLPCLSRNDAVAVRGAVGNQNDTSAGVGSTKDLARKNLLNFLQSRPTESSDGSWRDAETFAVPRHDSAQVDAAKKYQQTDKPKNVPVPPSHIVEQCLQQESSAPDQYSQEGVPLKEDPIYAKYFKMLKLGLPLGAVKNALQRDGLDPRVMDGDHNAPVLDRGEKKSLVQDAPKKDTHRHVRLHWHTHANVRKDTVWFILKGDSDVSAFNGDKDEESRLFETELKPVVKITDATTPGESTAPAVRVIDPKRANNGGIVLARIKLTYDEMARAVDAFDVAALSPEQIRGIIHLLPTVEETRQLKKYLASNSAKTEVMCECEKFMVAMMDVPQAKPKLDALLFMQKLATSIKELRDDAHLVQLACEEIVASVRFRKVLGGILAIGNRLNTAGATGSKKARAAAFTLESLLILNQAKAFDKKTTLLQYVAKVVRDNAANLARFKEDMPAVIKAQKVHWDLTLAEMTRLEHELENVRQVALSHGRQANNIDAKLDEILSDDSDTLGDETQGLSLSDEAQLLQSTTVGVFTLQACVEVASVVDAVQVAKQKHMEVLRYFGEEDKKDDLKPHKMFQVISTFCSNFDDAIEEVIADEKMKTRQSKSKNNHVFPKFSQGMESPSRKKFGSNMTAVLSDVRNKSKKKMRWGRKKR